MSEPIYYTTDDLGRDYGDLLKVVKTRGQLTSPRGQITIEVRPLVLHLLNPQACVVRRPGFSRALMWLEIMMLLAGEYNPELLEACAPNAAKLTNAYGAYGPRIKEQLPEVETELRRDPDSRRAVVYLGRPDDLRLSRSYDTGLLDAPCTMAWQFFVRDNLLEMHVFMRSWDLVWGLSYDVPCFVAVQQAVACALEVGLGSFTHVAGSGHIYEKHFDVPTEVESYRLPCAAADSIRETQASASQTLKLIQRGVSGRWHDFDPIAEARPEWTDAVAALAKKLL